jgi:2-oxoisovalerate dehydrogenase E1 component
VKQKNIKTDSDCLRFVSDDEDVRALGAPLAARIVFQTHLINAFEEELLKLSTEGCVWGPVHVSVGQEAAAAAIMAAIGKTDMITGSHRAHHQFLAKTLDCVLPDTWDPRRRPFPAEGQDVVRRTLGEIMGLKIGYCGGRGGSMHLHNAAAGVMGTNAIVGGGIPMATGLAYAEQFRGTGNIVLSFFGDGSVNIGSFHEALNLGGLWKLPIIYVIENNEYAVATHASQATAIRDICLRCGSYGMHGRQVEGDDVAAMYNAFHAAAEDLRNGGAPYLIEVRCYRHYHHKGEKPGSVYKYRTVEEEEAWRQRDAIGTFPETLKRLGMLKAKDVERLRRMAREAVDAAAEACTARDPAGARMVRPDLWPDPASAGEFMRSDGRELDGLAFREPEDFKDFEEMKYSGAIAAVTGRWLGRNSEALVFGEDVANFGGGPYGATKGLPQSFPKQVINTPIAEAGFAGVSMGTAVAGMPTVFELMYPDFCLVAADQLFNQIGKARHMYGGHVELPVVCRTRIATGTGFGGQHSMDPGGLFAMFSGWRIIAPSDAFDYIGLFNTAMHSKDPVLILEHHTLYGKRFPVPKGDLDYCIPFGRARVIGEGKDLTVIGYGSLPGRLQRLKPEIEAHGVSIEIIDLRTLDLPALDFAAIGRSVEKTGAVAIVEEAPAGQGLGPRIAAGVTEQFFDLLDAPPCCLASLDVPLSVSKVLEDAAMISDTQIVAALTAAAKREQVAGTPTSASWEREASESALELYHAANKLNAKAEAR